MEVEQVLDYVMETPGNTNRTILKEMINSVGGEDNNTLFKVIAQKDFISDDGTDNTCIYRNTDASCDEVALAFNEDDLPNTFFDNQSHYIIIVLIYKTTNSIFGGRAICFTTDEYSKRFYSGSITASYGYDLYQRDINNNQYPLIIVSPHTIVDKTQCKNVSCYILQYEPKTE